jgi:hypothetical protein
LKNDPDVIDGCWKRRELLTLSRIATFLWSAHFEIYGPLRKFVKKRSVFRETLLARLCFALRTNSH